MRKGFGINWCILIFLTTIFTTLNVIAIELYLPCNVNDDKSCAVYNTSVVICLPIRPNDPPEEPGLCNCKWNEDYPEEYDLDETSLECVALVGSHCQDNDVDRRRCVENAVCVYEVPGNDDFGRCDCFEHFMVDASRRCVEKTLGYHEECEIDGVPVDYNCTTFLDFSTNTSTTLVCVPKDADTKWCDCEGNENEIDYLFYNNKCQGLVDAPCDEDALSCFQNTIDSTFCNDENKCECAPGYSANGNRLCIEEPIPGNPLEFNSTCVVGDENLPCLTYNNTVDCIRVELNVPARCLCKGSEDHPNDYGYDLDKDLGQCVALVGSNCENVDCVQNSTCTIFDIWTSICQCDDGYVEVPHKICISENDIITTSTEVTTTEDEETTSELVTRTTETTSTETPQTTTRTPAAASSSFANKLLFSSCLVIFVVT